MRHCDEYIDDEDAPTVLRQYLAHARSPAHGMLTGKEPPKLYATWNGSRVRVVMASRAGDVGITVDLGREVGYEHRVYVEELGAFSETP